jgi:hypothetical protein
MARADRNNILLLQQTTFLPLSPLAINCRVRTARCPQVAQSVRTTDTSPIVCLPPTRAPEVITWSRSRFSKVAGQWFISKRRVIPLLLIYVRVRGINSRLTQTRQQLPDFRTKNQGLAHT